MSSTTSSAATAGTRRAGPLRSWRTAVSAAAILGGAAAIVGSLLPWAEVFAGLIGVPGTRGLNGKLLAAAGVLLAAAGIWHLVRGGAASRWLIGFVGAGVLGYAAYLLMRLAGTLRSVGGDSMLAVRGGPGLWVVAAGGLVAFATLFFPSCAQAALVSGRRDGAGLAAWAADYRSAGPRRWLQIGLGLVWLLDAALQFQPYMFTRGFVTQILEPAGMGSPPVVSRSIMGTGQIMLSHVAIFNGAFATIQLLIAAGLLWRRTSRAALAATIAWALSVWWLGEGLGGILTGSASPVTGAPGAALLYAAIAVLAWPPRAGEGASVAAGSRIGALGARLLWAALWVSSAYFVLQGPNRVPGTLRSGIAGQAGGEPGWIAALDRGAASAVGSHDTAISVALAAAFLIIAAGVFVPVATRPVLILAVVTALAMWAVGQNFGAMLTGQGTDPGPGPLLILLAAAYWPLRRVRQPPAAPGPERPQAASVPAGVSRAAR